MKRTTLATAILTLAAMLAVAPWARAVDGTIGINEAKVLAAGGFPYVISNPGSYRLTGNLYNVPANTDAIDVNVVSSGVTIDLNGFSITTSAATTALGINGPSASEVTVENGLVSGFATAIDLYNNAIVKNVHVDFNSTNGIVVGNDSAVQNCTANSNTNGDGIECYIQGCKISGNTANFDSNGVNCISADCTISNNTAIGDGAGIACYTGCAISGNATGNGYIGIQVLGSGSTALYNTANSNASYGISASDATTGYGWNVLYANNGAGAQITGGTSLGAGNTNLCNGTPC